MTNDHKLDAFRYAMMQYGGGRRQGKSVSYNTAAQQSYPVTFVEFTDEELDAWKAVAASERVKIKKKSREHGKQLHGERWSWKWRGNTSGFCYPSYDNAFVAWIYFYQRHVELTKGSR